MCLGRTGTSPALDCEGVMVFTIIMGAVVGLMVGVFAGGMLYVLLGRCRQDEFVDDRQWRAHNEFAGVDQNTWIIEDNVKLKTKGAENENA